MLNVYFNEKINDVYNNLNDQFEALNTRLKKLETQVSQISEVVKKREALIKGENKDRHKHHVSAIIGEKFWRVVEQEKLQ